MVFVAIDTPEFHVLTVYFEHLAHNFYLLHTEMVVEVLYDVAFTVAQLNGNGVEVRFLGRPEAWRLQLTVELHMGGITGSQLFQLAHGLLSVEQECHGNIFGSLMGGVTNFYVGCHHGLAVVGTQFCG